MYDLYPLASGIYDDLGNPSGISIAYISGWLQLHYGKLNNEINTSYSGVSGTLDPALGAEEEDIFRELFNIKYYERAIATNLGAGGIDWIELREGDSNIRRVSKTEIAKAYISLKNQSQENLNYLVGLYKINNAVPNQVAGDDASGIYPYRSYPYGYRA